MKIVLTLATILFFTQNTFAKYGEDPNLAKSETSTSEAGSVALAAVPHGGQPPICTTCQTAGQARLSNQIGVWRSGAGGAVTGGSSQPVETGN